MNGDESEGCENYMLQEYKFYNWTVPNLNIASCHFCMWEHRQDI
jgi:hypothetical protein